MVLTLPVLLAILLPVFAQARFKARGATCMSNIRQTDLAVAMYVQDYDATFPRGRDWVDVTLPYVRNENVYHCPLAGSVTSISYGYAYNDNLSAISNAKVKQPQSVGLIYDSTDLRRNAYDPMTSLPVPGRHTASGRGNNIGFADGHAAFWPESRSPVRSDP